MNEKPQTNEAGKQWELQKDLEWVEARQNKVSDTEAFLLGDPYAKPLHRAGMAVFAFFALLFSVTITSMLFQKHFEEGWGAEFVLSLVSFVVSLWCIRKACRRPARRELPPHPRD